MLFVLLQQLQQRHLAERNTSVVARFCCRSNNSKSTAPCCSLLQVVKMMIALVVIFGLCWLPYHSYFIIIQIQESIRSLPYIQQAYILIYWLAMSNSMYNPIIYCLMNAR